MDIFVNPPRDVLNTYQEFKKFSYYELASFFINYKFAISDEDGEMRIWTTDYEVYEICRKNWRFKGCVWYERPKAELLSCVVDGEDLKATLRSKFSHLFFK